MHWVGCASSNFRSGRPAGFKPEAVVIHIAEGSLASVDAWFNNQAAVVSAHYCVGKNGDVHQYVKEEDTAYHAGNPIRPAWKLLKRGVNPNFYTIGIEHEGHAGDVWTEAQYAASAALVADIAKRWSIPLDADHVVMHREIYALRTCPGSQFDRSKFLALVKTVPANQPT